MYQANQSRYETMKYHRCGASGLQLPEVSLGFWHNFGDTGVYENMKQLSPSLAMDERLWASLCHVQFWDYTPVWGNLRGRVCLPFAVIWGFLGLGLVYLLHPQVSALTALIPDVLLPPVTLLFAVDFALTGHVLRRSENTAALRWYLE